MTVNFNANIKLLMGGSFIGGSNWNKPANEIDKCYKIYHFKDGEAQISSNKQKYSLTSGNLYFINGYSVVSQQCPGRMAVDWVHFIPESVYFNHLLKNNCEVVLLDQNEFSSFYKLFAQFNDFFDGSLPEPIQRVLLLEIQSFLQFSIAGVFRGFDDRHFEDDSAFIRLSPALEYITTNYRENICLNEIADKCNLSPNYFHRLFSQTFEISPFNYIRQMRMEEAIRQLFYTNKTVKEISFDTGYDDEAYFSRTFSKLYHISPGKYRTINRKKLP